MNSFIPLSTLKRDEIYSFIGGFFIASSWYVYFLSLSNDTSVSSIDLVAKPIFLISWLISTALLFTIQLFTTLIIAQAIKYWLKSKNQMERKKVLGLQDPVEDFVSVEFVNDVKYSVHLVGIITISMLLSLFPLYKLSSSFITQNTSRLILFLIVLALLWLSFILIKFWKMFIVVHLLKADGSLEIIDPNTYAQERASYIAKVANERSKQKVQNYLDQQGRTDNP
ncbi:MAG: hypothetical protein ABII09_01180 [Planctomycetota bacterium]